MCSINKIQKDRERFLYQLLEYDSGQKKFNPHFIKDDMLKLLGVNEGEFNKIQKSLGDIYCTYVDTRNDKDRYIIHTSECWVLHDKFEDWKLNKSLKKLTISLMVVAVLTLIVALPSAIDTCSKFKGKNQNSHSEATINISDKPVQKEINQKASSSEVNEMKPEKPDSPDKLIKKDEKPINKKGEQGVQPDRENDGNADSVSSHGTAG